MKGLYLLVGLLLVTSFAFGQFVSTAPGPTGGAWNVGTTWGGGACSPCVAGVDYPGAGDAVTISSMDVVTVPASFSAAATTITLADGTSTDLTTLAITAGGSLTTTGVSLTAGANVRLNVGGTITASGNITGATLTKMVVGVNGTYRHNFTSVGGNIPTATWTAGVPGATLEIIGYTTFTGGAMPTLLPPVYNFTWNCPSQAVNVYFSTGLNTINGNLTIQNTGGRILGFNTAGGKVMAVFKDVTLASGVYFDLNSNGAVTTVLNARGNFTLNSDDAIQSSGGGNASVNFNGATPQQFINNNDASLYTDVDFTVNGTSILALPDENFLSGFGDVTVNGTIQLGSLNADGPIQTAGVGNIRNYGSQSFPGVVEFSGAAAQFIGGEHPSAANVKISNSSGVSIAASVSGVQIDGSLTLSGGNLNVGSKTLTINGSFTPNTNFIGVTASSNLSIGTAGNFGTLAITGSSSIAKLTLNLAGKVTLANDLTLTGLFIHTNGELDFTGRSLTISGAYTRTGGTFTTSSASTLVVDGSGTISGGLPISGSTLGTFTLNRSAGASVASVTIGTALNLLSGTLTGNVNMPTPTPTLQRANGALAGTLSASSYNLIYSPTTTITTGPELLNGAVNDFSKSGAGDLNLNQTLDINGVLTMSAGTFNSNANLIYLGGNYINSGGTTSYTGSTITFDGNTTLSGGSTFSFPSIAVVGTLNLGSQTVNISGNIDHDNPGGITIPGTSTVTFNGSTTITTSNLSVPNFNNLNVATSGSLIITCADAPNCGAEPNQFSIQVAGNWNSNNSGAVFTPNGSRVILNGTTQNITMLPAQAFSTLELSGASSITLSQPLNITNDLVIGTTASLNTGAGSHTINLGDDFIANGSFTPNTGTVTLNGTSNQNFDRVAGSGAATKDFYNINVNKSAGQLRFESTIANTTFRVANEFRISQNGSDAVDVDFDGSTGNGVLVLRSTSGSTARIPAIPSGANTIGNLTVERFIQNDAVARAYRYLAAPVSGATVADWLGEIQITGAFSNPSSGGGIPNPNAPSLYRWVETAGGVEANRWEAYPNNVALPASSFGLDNGRGYSVYVRNTGTPTTDVRGTLNEGNINVALTVTGPEANAAGYNLVGNPYPAPIDWDSFSLPGGVSATIAMKNNVDNANAAIGQFIYYTQNGPSVGNFDGVIASGQAFWVQATSAASLAFTESLKTSDVNPIVVREAALADILRVKMHGNGLEDETVVYVREEATENFDLKFDAQKRPNDYLNLYTFFNEPSKKFAINGFSEVGCSKTIRLGLTQVNANGVNILAPGSAYYLEFQEMESFNGAFKFFLADDFTGKTIELTQAQPVYQFSITSDAASYGDSRFRITMTSAETAVTASAQSVANCGPGVITLTASGASANGSYRWYESADATVPVSTTKEFKTPNLTESKTYYVSAVTSTGCEGGRIQVKAEIAVFNQTATAQSVANCGPGVITLTASGAPANGSYRWYESDDATVPVSTTREFKTPSLTASKTYYVSVVNSTGCEGAKIQVKAEVIILNQAVISVNQDLMESNYESGNQWLLNDVPIAGAVGKTYKPDQSGIYKVQVTQGDCKTISAAREYVATVVTAVEDDFSQSSGKVNIYPNPVETIVNVVVQSQDKVNIRLVNTLGVQMGSAELQQVDHHTQQGSLEMRSMAPGIYMLNIQTGNQTYQKKILKK